MGKDSSKNEHIITRGNVDGIVSAAVFLNRFPAAKVTFVTSPAAAARQLSMDRMSDEVYVVDMSVTEELANAYRQRRNGQNVRFLDHHQPSSHSDGIADIFIDEGRSAAGSLHLELGPETTLDCIVAVADLAELSLTEVLEQAQKSIGSDVLENEVKVLDFSWRADVNDDLFRLEAARGLSKGSLPSEVPEVMRRYTSVIDSGTWPRALARVRRTIEKRGPFGVLRMEKRMSLHGFGSRAVSEVAKEMGCDYAVIMNDGIDSLSVSLRSIGEGDLNLGRFVETFTKMNGHDGGGHPSSAGARIPRTADMKLIEELESAVS